MTKNAGTPPLPRGWQKNPAGQVTRVKREQRRMRVALRDVRDYALKAFDDIPKREITANANGITVNAYDYLIDLPELERIVEEIRRRLGDDLPAQELWESVRAAYEEGTGDQVANLAAISSDYTREITQVIQSDPWQRRVALVRARVFEEMEGFAGDTGRDLGRVLSQAVQDGINPMDAKKLIKQRFGVSASRAERIARTEIVNAYRRARWDEDRDANQRLGIKTGLLWLSAFAPNSRKTHMALNGDVVDQEFVREFYSESKNSVNCMCSQVSVLLNDDGLPMTPDVIDRVKKNAPKTEGVPIANTACICGQ